MYQQRGPKLARYTLFKETEIRDLTYHINYLEKVRSRVPSLWQVMQQIRQKNKLESINNLFEFNRNAWENGDSNLVKVYESKKKWKNGHRSFSL